MWKNIEINLQNIKHDTGKATLIKMPNNSFYAGYVFWHPSKLVRYGSNSYARSIGYTDKFTFKLKKYGKGKYNFKDVIDEIEISAEEFEEEFRRTRVRSTKTYLHVTEPEKVDKKIEIENSLLNNKESQK